MYFAWLAVSDAPHSVATKTRMRLNISIRTVRNTAYTKAEKSMKVTGVTV